MKTDAELQKSNEMFFKNIGVGGIVSILKILVQLALMPIMAHLLGPKEFGLYALAVPVVLFLSVIADGGVGLSLARERTNSPIIWSTAFWILIVLGLGLSILVIVIGYFISVITSEPQVRPIMLILATSFPFLSISVLPIARLIRTGNLFICSIADFLATMFGAIGAVGLGLLDFGAKSLAFQYLIVYIVRSVVLNSYAFERPAAIFRPSAMISHLSSGGILMGSRVADLACRSIEGLLFSNLFGPAALGAYNFANQIPRFLFEAFSNPTWSALYAQILNEEPDRRQLFYYKMCRLLAFVTFPSAALLTACSADFIGQLLGPSWHLAGVFLVIFAPGYAVGSTASMGSAVLLAFHFNKAFFLTAVMLSVCRVVSVAAGYFLSEQSAVWLVSISNIAYAVIVSIYVRKAAGTRLFVVLNSVRGPFFASAFSGLVCWSFIEIFGNSQVALIFSILLGVSCYLLAVLIVDGKRVKEEIALLRKTVLKGKTL